MTTRRTWQEALAIGLLGVGLTAAYGCSSNEVAKPDSSTVGSSGKASTKPEGGTAMSAKPVESAKPAEPPKPADPLAGWVKYSSPGGKYELMMPSTPKEEDTQAPTAAGPMTLHMATSITRDGAYFAQYADVAGRPFDLDGAVSGMGVTTSSVKEVKVLGKHPGREVEGTKEGVKVFAQIFVVEGKRFVTLMTANISDATKVRAFWDSFKETK